MKKDAFVKWVIKELEKRYPDPAIPLKHTSAYTLLVAVLLSAQCTDERVNQVTPGLFSLADTPEKMAKRSVDEVLEHVRPCGLGPTKAKNIVALSKTLVEKWGGLVPCSLQELEKLPGVGHKTASVVMIQAFSEPAFPVDTHIHRLAERWGLSDGTSVTKTEKDLKKIFPKKLWGKIHLQMIYFGRQWCPARGHDPKVCPICAKVAL